MLSKTFQLEDVDIVATSELIGQLRRIEEKDFFQLPTVKRFLDNVVETEGRFTFQDVTLKDSENAKEQVKKIKNEWVRVIGNAIEARLETTESATTKYSVQILNTEGWLRCQDNEEFCDEALEELYKILKTPLESAGFSGSCSDLFEQWHNLTNYTVKYLNPQKNDYRVVWRLIF